MGVFRIKPTVRFIQMKIVLCAKITSVFNVPKKPCCMKRNACIERQKAKNVREDVIYVMPTSQKSVLHAAKVGSLPLRINVLK